MLLTLLQRRFYFGNDDLLQFRVASRAGLSWEMLSLNVFQHFAPYNRAAHLAVYSLTDLSPAAGMAFMTVNYVAMLAACLWFMTELGLSTRRRVLALILIGLSVSVTESAIWFDASMHILPAIAITFAVCAAHVRGVRTGAGRWHVLALVLFVAGQLVQERPLFALPLAVLADVFLLWRDLPWRERVTRLWAVRWPLASLAVAALLIAVALQAFVVERDFPTPGWTTTGRTMLLALTGYLIPSLANVPLATAPSLPAQFAVLAATVTVGVVLARMRRGNAGPLLFAAGAFVLYYGFLKFSPLLTTASIPENAERLHYAVYVTPAAAIALVHLRLPFGGTAGRRRLTRVLTVAGAAALAGWLAFANHAYLERQWAVAPQARAYLDAVRADADAWSAPDVTVMPLWVHPAMTTGWAVPFGRHDRFLDLIDKGFRPRDLGDEPVIIDHTGAVRPVELSDVPGEVRVESGQCGPTAQSGRTSLVARAEFTRSREQLFVVVSYRARRDLDVQVVTDFPMPRQEAYFRDRLPRGQHTRVIPIDDLDVRRLTLSSVRPGDYCLDDLRVVRVVLTEASGRSCSTVDRYGRPERPIRCP